jgi:hypothetical protein
MTYIVLHSSLQFNFLTFYLRKTWIQWKSHLKFSAVDGWLRKFGTYRIKVTFTESIMMGTLNMDPLCSLYTVCCPTYLHHISRSINKNFLKGENVIRLQYLSFLTSYNDAFIDSFSCHSQLEHRAPFEVSVITHTIRQMVGLLWTSDHPVAETSTYTGQHNI